MLISSSLILLLTIVATIFLPAFGLKSGVSILALVPFLLLSLIVFAVAGFGIYIGIRYLKGNTFKENKNLGTLLVLLGVIYFISTLLSYLFSNLTDNLGGELKPILAFIWLILTLPIGLALRNGCKK